MCSYWRCPYYRARGYGYDVILSLVPTSDVSGLGIGIGIGRTLRASGNQNDGSRSGIGRKRDPSDPYSDSVELPIPIATPFLIYTRTYKAPYTSDYDSDSASDSDGNSVF